MKYSSICSASGTQVDNKVVSSEFFQSLFALSQLVFYVYELLFDEGNGIRCHSIFLPKFERLELSHVAFR